MVEYSISFIPLYTSQSAYDYPEMCVVDQVFRPLNKGQYKEFGSTIDRHPKMPFGYLAVPGVYKAKTLPKE